MPPNALVSEWKFNHEGATIVQDPYLGNVRSDIYNIVFKPLIPEILQYRHEEGTRYETIAYWSRSSMEIRRKVAKAASWPAANPSFHKAKRQFSEWLWPHYVDFHKAKAQYILTEGDWSLENFTRYVREHKKSSTGYGYKWSYLLHPDRERQLATAWTELCLILRTHLNDLLDDSTYNYLRNRALHPSTTYPALRSRPGDAGPLSKFGDVYTVRVRKHRDRSAGGIKAISQKNFPVFFFEDDFASEYIQNMFKKILGINVKFPVLEGVQHFIDFIEDDRIKTVSDDSCKELQTGSYLGSIYKLNSSVQGISTSEMPGYEMLSGNPDTPEENDIDCLSTYGAYQEIYGESFHGMRLYLHSDNHATTKYMFLDEIDEWLDYSDRYLGFIPAKRPKEARIGGTRLCKDDKEDMINISATANTYSATLKRVSLNQLAASLLVNNLLKDQGLSFYQALKLVPKAKTFSKGRPLWSNLDGNQLRYTLPRDLYDTIISAAIDFCESHKIDYEPNLQKNQWLETRS